MTPSSPTPARYDAFISYSHEADHRLAREIERTLERLGKPWYKRRRRHVPIEGKRHMYAVLRTNGQQLCIDLRRFGDVAPDTLESWCTSYRKGFGAGTLFAVAHKASLPLHSASAKRTVTINDRWRKKAQLYTPDALSSQIAAENRTAFDILVAQLRSPLGVVPFVGAGLSVSFGFPGWPKFLKDAAAFHRSPDEIVSLVKRNRLIEAASLLSRPDADRFQRLVERAFGAPIPDEQVRTGPVSLLPLLCKGPSITTNFDRVLETAFRVAGSPFYPAITAIEPDNVIRAMHRNEHVLIKLHGDALDRSARVFTGFEYDRRYGRKVNGQRRRRGSGSIPKLARVMFTNRPLLFLGSSLEKDRTLEVLRDLHREVPGITHYAILAADYSIEALTRRRDELGQYGIVPLWFLPGDFERIEQILGELLLEASTRLVRRGPAAAAPTPRRDADAQITATAERRRTASKGRLHELTRRIAERCATGDLCFFLGAGIHLDRLPSARAFYRSLAVDYGFDEDDAQRAEVAQYLIDREGKYKAWAACRDRLMNETAQASVVCEFVTELPSLLRQAGRHDAANLWMLTTNYDVVLEKQLEARGEPFHLLSYQVDGPNEGCFVHRDLGGTLRVIERPTNIRRLGPPATVLVKVDGGISYDAGIPETVAFSPLDFAASAGRVLNALPEAVRHVLSSRSLLVLGSSLRDAHVQRIVRWSAGISRSVKTWAVMKPVTATARQLWPAGGVELINCDLEVFVGRFKQHLQSGTATVDLPPVT